MHYLCIKLHVRCAKAYEAREQALVKVAVLLEGHVLNHWWQLMMVTNQDDALQASDAIFLPLQHHGDESLNLQHLQKTRPQLKADQQPHGGSGSVIVTCLSLSFHSSTAH